MQYLTLCEKNKNSRKFSPMYERIFRAVELHIERKNLDVVLVRKHTGTQISRELNSTTMIFMNGKNPIHMYFLMQGRGSVPEYLRADSFPEGLKAILYAMEEVFDVQDPISSRD